MRKFSKKQYLVAGVAAAAVVAVGTGTAIAYWSTTGQGAGSATTASGSTVAITDSTTATPLTPMYPGDSPQQVTVTVTNSSNQKAYVGGVTVSLSVSKATGAQGNCDATDYQINGSEATTGAMALAWTAGEIAANSSATTTYTIQFYDNPTTNQDGCKGASVAMNYVSS